MRNISLSSKMVWPDTEENMNRSFESHPVMFLDVQRCCGQKLVESKCTSLVTFVSSLGFRTNPSYRRLSKDTTVNFFYQSELKNCYPVVCP